MSWLDSMPSSWELRSPKSLFNERRTSNLPDDVHLTPSQKYGVLPQSEYIELTGGSVVLNLTGQNAMKHVEPNDFIIHLRSFQGGLEHARQSGKVSTAYTVVEPKNATNPEFYKWLLKSKAFIQELQTTTNQLRDGQSIRWTDFVKVPLPTPPLDEQRAIADYLDRETQKIDELITEQRSLIETLRERRYACIERAVTCGISDAQLGESSIPWIARMPLDWGVSRMKHETAMTTGGTPDTDDLAYWSEASDEAGVPWVAISDMSRRRSVCSTSKRLTPAGVASKRLRIGKAGTILFAMYASVGEVSRLDVDATWNQAILGITPGDRLESGYLAYLLMAMRTFMLGEVRTNTQANLNARQVGDMPLPIPLLEEQREIVDYLDEQTARIDELISESEDLIALSQECRAALITAAVTGQIDVREAA